MSLKEVPLPLRGFLGPLLGIELGNFADRALILFVTVLIKADGGEPGLGAARIVGFEMPSDQRLEIAPWALEHRQRL